MSEDQNIVDGMSKVSVDAPPPVPDSEKPASVEASSTAGSSASAPPPAVVEAGRDGKAKDDKAHRFWSTQPVSV